jgi:hypothetical protein
MYSRYLTDIREQFVFPKGKVAAILLAAALLLGCQSTASRLAR